MNDLKPTAGSSSCMPSWSSRACIITVAILLLMAVLLLGQPSSLFRPAAHTSGGSALTMIPSHLLLGAEHTSGQHPGFASHADDVTSQPWLEQGAAALPSTDDGRPTAVALPADAASDDPTLTDVQALYQLHQVPARYGRHAAGPQGSCKPCSHRHCDQP